MRMFIKGLKPLECFLLFRGGATTMNPEALCVCGDMWPISRFRNDLPREKKKCASAMNLAATHGFVEKINNLARSHHYESEPRSHRYEPVTRIRGH